jgi:hypothetical protein
MVVSQTPTCDTVFLTRVSVGKGLLFDEKENRGRKPRVWVTWTYSVHQLHVPLENSYKLQ